MHDPTGRHDQPDHDAFLTGFAEDYLHGVRDVEVRPLTFDHIAALASGNAPQRFQAFRADDTGALTPVVVTVNYRHGAPSVNTTFAMNPVSGRLDRATPVGARLRVEIETGFGGKTSGFLFTTEEAEDASGFGSRLDPDRTRTSLFLPADNPIDGVLNIDPEAAATVTEHRPLAAVHGSEISLACVVAGIAPDDLAARVRALIEAEFGARIGAIIKVDATVVGTQRVDVYDAESGVPLAVNVLAVEANYLMGKSESGMIETRPAALTGVIVGR